MIVNFFDLFRSSSSSTSSTTYCPLIKNITLDLPFYYSSNLGLLNFARNLKNLNNSIVFKNEKNLSYIKNSISSLYTGCNNLKDCNTLN